jgi:hypothetical protein
LSLSQRAADTEKTLQSILTDIFQKIDKESFPLDQVEENQIDGMETDMTDNITNAMKTELLKNAGQPLRRYINLMSDIKLKRILERRRENHVSFSIQTVEVKSV